MITDRITLAEMLSRRAEQRAQEERTREEQRIRELEEAHDRRVRELGGHIDKHLPPELQNALGLHYDGEIGECPIVKLHFLQPALDEMETWQLWRTADWRTDGIAIWKLKAPDGRLQELYEDGPYPFTDTTLSEFILDTLNDHTATAIAARNAQADWEERNRIG